MRIVVLELFVIIQRLTTSFWPNRFHPLIGTWGPAVPCSRKTDDIKPGYEHQEVSSVWNISSDGTLRATLAGEPWWNY